ncbi:MAG TPA: hypothetical protein VG498_04365 [Terriglobales bacterium]|nr:hypothetical protein [Terriglobales bacterium]
MQFQLHSRLVTFLLAFALLLVAGCKKKTPKVPSPQTQAPTVVTPTPEQQVPQQQPTPTTQPQPEQQTPPTPTTPEQAPTPEKPSPSKPARTNRRHPAASTNTAKKPPAPSPAPATPAPANPPANAAKTTSPDSEVGQISPDISRTAAAQAQQSTAQLLDATEQNLRNLTRTLSNDEQNAVSQIRSYIVQARNALKNQELELAHNLAVKAHQLSDGLLKQ